MKSIETLNQKLNPLRHFKPKQKRLFRLGCAALALALAVGTVPFLRGWAANEQAVVSDSDSVSGTDTVITNSITVEPKPAKGMIGDINWQRLDSVDDLNNAALSSKSTITLGMVSNWVNNYLDAFAAENGYPDASKLGFISDRSSSDWISLTYRSQYGMQMVSSSINNYSDFSLFYIPRVPATGVIFSHTRLDLNVGDTETVTGELSPADTNDKIVWNSQDTTVVTIKENGTVTAVGCGSTTITATVYNDVYEIPVTVSGQSFVNLDELGISGWVLATSWEEIKNAAYIDTSLNKSWFSLQRKKYPNRKWVYKYDPETEEAYQRSISSGSFTEETFATMSNVYYIPKLPSYTYHPAQPATCTQHATIAYWTDQDGNKFLNANTENPIDSIYDETSPLGDHVWGEWLVTREPTCGESGEKKHTCSECNTFETEPIDPDPTKHSLTHHEAVAATCTATGTKENWECSLCHKRFSDNAGTVELTDLTAVALGHEWGSEAWNWAADYSSASVTLTCGRCHAEKTLTDNAPHIGTVVSQPTCTENKVVRYVANVQDDEDDSVFYSATSVDVEVANTALGHTWGNWVTDKEPTCEKPGEKHEECAVCHEKRSEHTEVEALGHNWGEWTVTKEATETEAGEEERVCQNDPTHKETRVIPVILVIKVTEGGGTHEIKKDGDLNFRFVIADHDSETIDAFNAALEDDSIKDVVTVSGKNYSKTLTNTEYKAESGSLRLTLTKAYLDTLKPGDYTVTVKFKISGSVYESSSTFKIASSGGSNPGTGEDIMIIGSMLILFILSLSVLTYMAFTDKLFRAKLLAVPAGITSFFSRSDANNNGSDDQKS